MQVLFAFDAIIAYMYNRYEFSKSPLKTPENPYGLKG